MEELKQLKQTLRSLVVSSPTQVDVRSLLRDFRNMMGEPLPASKYGYRDPLLFLRERFSDCFLFQGPPSNPTLTLIVPDTLKHIDKFVQSQKMSSNNKFKGKRRSVPDSILGAPPPRLMPNLDNAKNEIRRVLSMNTPEPPREIVKSILPLVQTYRELPKETVKPASNNVQPPEVRPSANKENLKQPDGNWSRLNLENFLRKRTAMNSSQHLDSETYKDDGSGKHTSDSGRQASSSSSSTKRMQLEQLKEEVKQLVLDRPEGVRCLQLMKLYREHYHRELNFLRFGFTSVVSFACSLEPAVLVSDPDESGDCLLRDARRTPDPPAAARPRALVRRLSASRLRPAAVDPDDALPGIDFDPDVFPADCMHFMESISGEPLDDLLPGAMVEVMVGEVYSPSHIWLMRLGERHNIAMEDMMDEMTAYYNKGEGQNRSLALGAVRVGHYCSSIYENDWHRSLIVKIIDSDTVKVRHVDYGTVDTVSTCTLRPLLRRWASLPAQALRARLAAVRPPAAGRRWPHPAASALLRLVRDKRFVANVAAVDTEHDVIEVFLIDTSTDKDICIGTELIREGHADPRADSALRVSDLHDDTSDDDDLDVRSLVTTISQFRYDDLSEVSASASEVVGREPRRLPTWECDKDDASTISSVRLCRLKALHSHLNETQKSEDVSEAGSTVLSPESASSVSSMTSCVLRRKLEVSRQLRRLEKSSSGSGSSGEACSVISVGSELLRKKRALAEALRNDIT